MPPKEPHSVVEVALKAALLVHQSGGDTTRAESTMRRVAVALEAERVDTMVSSLSLTLNAKLNGVFVTGMRRAPHMGVNFRVLTGMERALHSLEDGRIGMEKFEELIDKLAEPRQYYPAWLVVICVGIACGGFAAMFMGDRIAIAITILGGMAGMATRLLLVKWQFKPFIMVTGAAFVATMVTGLLKSFTTTPDIAIAACVLFLIPGVPLINGASDLLNNNYLNAMVRLAMGTILIIGLSLGMSIALRIVH